MSTLRYKICLFCLLACLPLSALDIDYRLSMRAGMILPDGKVDATVNKKGQWIGPSAGGEFAVSFHPEWQSLREWNGACIGAALSYWKLDATLTGDKDLLGHSIAPYIFVEIPFYKSSHFEIGARPGFGCAFITKTYFNTATPEQQYNVLQEDGINQSVGSVTNYFFPEAIYLNFPIRKGWTIGLAGGWYHMSNGSTIQPNSGYNIFCGELNVRYRPEDEHAEKAGTQEKATKELGLAALRAHHCEVEFGVACAARQVYYKDRQTFFCSDIQMAAYWRAHRIFRLGGGVDIFYDGAYYDRPTLFGKTYLRGATQADCWRVGVSVQPEFVMGYFSLGIHLGVYLYDPVKNREVSKDDKAAYDDLWINGHMPNKGVFYSYDLLKAGSGGYPDGWFYTRIAAKYHLPYHLFVQASIKVHLTKVEFIGAGLGVYL